MPQQKKAQSQNTLNQDELETLTSKVFTEKNGKIFIGGKELPEVSLSTLKDEARYIQNSRLWEIINATIINESSNMALIQSANWDHVLSAKQLHHWGFVMRNMLHALNK